MHCLNLSFLTTLTNEFACFLAPYRICQTRKLPYSFFSWHFEHLSLSGCVGVHPTASVFVALRAQHLSMRRFLCILWMLPIMLPLSFFQMLIVSAYNFADPVGSSNWTTLFTQNAHPNNWGQIPAFCFSTAQSIAKYRSPNSQHNTWTPPRHGLPNATHSLRDRRNSVSL